MQFSCPHFFEDILMKTSPLKTKKRLDGSIYMATSSVSRSKNLFLQQSLDLDLSFLPCKSFLGSFYFMIQAMS